MSNLPQIYVGEGNLQIVSDDVWAALVKANDDPPVFYRHGERIVQIGRDDRGLAVIHEVTQGHLVHRLARICRFWKFNRKNAPVSARLPKDVPLDLLCRTDKTELPLLRGVSAIPILGPRGRFQVTPGYDPETQLFYDPQGLDQLMQIGDAPPDYMVDIARELLLVDLLGDFPFASPAEKAHAVAALCQPFVRPSIDGATPLYMIEKPTPGSGATLLAHVIGYVVLGRFPAAVTQPQTEAEWRYGVMAWLRDGPSIILIDNLAPRLESSTFASVLTDTTYKDRIIGTSETQSVPVECLWLATGNNPMVSLEIARRIARIRLNPELEHPDLRSNFRHADLRGWVAESRPQIVWAILTLIQAWVAAGRPPGKNRLGGYESWSEVLGGILEVAGIEGFLENRHHVRLANNSENPNLRSFVERWWEALGGAPVGVAELWRLDADLDLGSGSEHSQRIRLGRLLDSIRDRQYGNLRVEKLGHYQGAQRYRLSRVPHGSACE